MNTLSLCMIVKDEEKVLDRCLKSIKDVVDEIIIVDTGSSDKTKNIASKYTDKIYSYKWCDDFSKARNYSFSLATCDYIIWLDADDVVSKKTANYIKSLKSNFEYDTYFFKYDMAFVDNKPTFSFYRERIVRNSHQAVWKGCVHECITPFGKTTKVNKSIEHRKIDSGKISYRNINIYEKTLKQRALSTREQYYYSRELFDHKRYEESLISLDNFLSRKDAWVENILDALFLKCKIYIHLKKSQEFISCALESFKYDKPRASFCSILGDYFLERKNFDTAIFWYKTALKCEDVTFKGGFVESKYYNYYPYLQLCVCYFNIGDYKKSLLYNEKAGKYFFSEIITKNRQIIQKYLEENKNSL